MFDKVGQTERKWSLGWIVFLVAAVALVLNFPLLNALLTSFKTTGDISAYPPKFLFEPTLQHFSNVLYAAGYDFPRFFLNSTILATCTSFLVIALSFPSAYAMLRLGFGVKWLLPATAGLRLLPPIIFAIPYYLMFQFLGLLDTITGLVLINTYLNLPLGLLLMIGFLRDVPVDIEEAARVDGCSIYQVLWRITLPLIGPGIAAVGILTFIFTWNDYLFALIISLSEARPVTVGAANFVTSYGVKWGDISAATILSVLPPMLFALLAQRYLVQGLSAGAVKG